MKAVDLQINLLPWRQKRREYQQRQFVNCIGACRLGGRILIGCLVANSEQPDRKTG